MGALHRGHEELIRASKAESDVTVVSIFVNPTQFNNQQDFERYPQTWDEDLALCQSLGVDAIFAPEIDTIYPPGFSTFIEEEGVSEEYEGRHRPGHFRGVATVCYQLFANVEPHIAFFGKKDLQQVAVVRRMIQDLHLDIQVKEIETVREPSGLAMSSRNRRLSAKEMSTAPLLFHELSKASALLKQGTSSPERVCIDANTTLTDAGFKVEYFDLVSSTTFQKTDPDDPNAHLIAAAWLGHVRLIDNLKL